MDALRCDELSPSGLWSASVWLMFSLFRDCFQCTCHFILVKIDWVHLLIKDAHFDTLVQRCLKGWLTVFFLGLIVFMGCSLTCVNALFCFFIIYLYSTPLCPFSEYTALMISWFYEAPPSEIRDGFRLVSWPSLLWLAKPPSAVQKRPAPHLRMRSSCIVNNGVVINIVYQFEPDWDPENISEEDHAELVQARLLQDVSEWYVSLFVFVSYF